MFSPIAAAGSTRRKTKKAKALRNSTTGKNGGKYVSYCPFCKPETPAKPQFAPRVTVGDIYKHQRTGTCKNGHTWELI